MLRRKDEQKVVVNENMRGGNGKIAMRHFLSEKEVYGAGRIFAVSDIPPGASIGYHAHENEFEFYYVLSGEVTIRDDEETYVMTAGDMMQCKNGHSHSIENRSAEHAEVLMTVLYDQTGKRSFMELARARFSVRKYADRPLKEEKLMSILEAARIAPSAKNAQSYKIYVARSKEAIEKIDLITKMRYGAPTVLMFAADTGGSYQYEDRNSGDQDCSIAATHVMLEACEQGVGTLWADNFSPSAAKELFGLPDNMQPVLLMPIGYAAEDAEPAPRHAEMKALEDIVEVL